MQSTNWEAAHRREGKYQLVGVGDWAEPLTGLCSGKAPLTPPVGHRRALQALHTL